ncbi:flagellar basal body rod protein FlgB [Salinimonas iocasae]|uniref:Flagellar basal body rod protein FlgB n=1 Tax=Salinimonas iocasae TaxID=2572577 RepID=A0A5B7YG56_9ALTE|nr:flagellar basal body rod protein FlgB [Salinimonas iocasae]QCZ94293.1 flagellar basal body rod protein FlgB [Salinimonas iocasae]|tara:strand:+ start:269 stop:673 length:405 start_codon:yes stop_codon:yes gene_type:complete
MAINLDKLVGFHQRAVNIREDRMEVIAGNLANANTPGYKARDIDFNKAMSSAREHQQGSMTRTSDKHFAGKMTASQFELQYRVPNQPDTGDGNTVEVQAERNAFLENGMRYQASLQFLDGKLKGMKKALSGGNG